MSNIVVRDENQIEYTDEKIKLLKDTIAKEANDNQLQLFLHVCKRTKLDPFARQIYVVLRYDKKKSEKVMTIQTSIDGFRLIAQRSGQYAGQLGPFWCGKDGGWVDVWLKPEVPMAAKVGVLRHDFKEPLWGVALFDAYASRFDNGDLMGLWSKMPELMIAKCAEALALRKAFPQELSGLYESNEISHSEQELIPQNGDKEEKVNSAEPEKLDPKCKEAVKCNLNSTPSGESKTYDRFVKDAPKREPTRQELGSDVNKLARELWGNIYQSEVFNRVKSLFNTEDFSKLSISQIKELKESIGNDIKLKTVKK